MVCLWKDAITGSGGACGHQPRLSARFNLAGSRLGTIDAASHHAQTVGVSATTRFGQAHRQAVAVSGRVGRKEFRIGRARRVTRWASGIAGESKALGGQAEQSHVATIAAAQANSRPAFIEHGKRSAFDMRPAACHNEASSLLRAPTDLAIGTPSKL